MADPLITKQAAAQRQIDAAIRMLLLHGEDICAIHTVAAAALAIAKDLAEAKGVGPAFETRRDLERLYKEHYGRDPMDTKVSKEIERRALAIESHKITWSHRNRIANFLKHADRDTDLALDSGDFRSRGGWYRATDTHSESGGTGTLDIIAFAINFYTNMNLPLTIEMSIYMHWWLGINAPTPEDIVNTKSGPIHRFTFEQQMDFGRGLLQLVYKRREGQRSDPRVRRLR